MYITFVNVISLKTKDTNGPYANSESDDLVYSDRHNTVTLNVKTCSKVRTDQLDA